MRLNFLSVVVMVTSLTACSGWFGNGSDYYVGTRSCSSKNISDHVVFAAGQDALGPHARATLECMVPVLNKPRSMKTTYIIEGYGDAADGSDADLALGWRRAQAVRDYLIAAGLNPHLIKKTSGEPKQPPAARSNLKRKAAPVRRVRIIAVTPPGAGSFTNLKL